MMYMTKYINVRFNDCNKPQIKMKHLKKFKHFKNMFNSCEEQNAENFLKIDCDYSCYKYAKKIISLDKKIKFLDIDFSYHSLSNLKDSDLFDDPDDYKDITQPFRYYKQSEYIINSFYEIRHLNLTYEKFKNKLDKKDNINIVNSYKFINKYIYKLDKITEYCLIKYMLIKNNITNVDLLYNFCVKLENIGQTFSFAMCVNVFHCGLYNFLITDHKLIVDINNMSNYNKLLKNDPHDLPYLKENIINFKILKQYFLFLEKTSETIKFKNEIQMYAATSELSYAMSIELFFIIEAGDFEIVLEYDPLTLKDDDDRKILTINYRETIFMCSNDEELEAKLKSIFTSNIIYNLFSS